MSARSRRRLLVLATDHVDENNTKKHSTHKNTNKKTKKKIDKIAPRFGWGSNPVPPHEVSLCNHCTTPLQGMGKPFCHYVLVQNQDKSGKRALSALSTGRKKWPRLPRSWAWAHQGWCRSYSKLGSRRANSGLCWPWLVLQALP